ncbi:MAG TPA: PEP-CTERM sorting domain-containing protein [Caulobacteraceae bacterium]|jgi:hypothetical protein|nr:PEP-CTERM sorting domain-containing protein [Caulobacteraceae bacterium]
MFIAMAALAAPPAHSLIESALTFAATQPGSWTMAIVGVGVLGAMFRWRRAPQHPSL